MDSDTLVESSPVKSFVNKAALQRQILREDLLKLLCPNLNMDKMFGLPMAWKESFLKQAQQQIIKQKYLVYQSEIESLMFPPILINRSIFNVGMKLTGNDMKIQMGIKWWFSMFNLSKVIHKVKPLNRLKYIRSLIYKYIKMIEGANNIKVIIDPRQFQRDLIIKYKDNFKMMATTTEDNNSNIPKFTILLMDIESPIVMLWQDDENVCSFNLKNLNLNDFYSQVRFTTTIQVFIEETLSLENVNDILLLI